MSDKIKNYWNELWVSFAKEHPTRGKNYYISNYGRIKSVDKKSELERLLKGSTHSRGYKVVTIRFIGNFQKTYSISKLVADAFCEQIHTEEKKFRFFDKSCEKCSLAL